MIWCDKNYRYRKKITINHTEILGDEVNFPILINITDADLTNCKANGYDIKFYNSSAVQLKHERELWNSATGQLVAWIKIPVLSSMVDTEIYMYYERPTETVDQSDAENVWDAHFVMVQHMNDTTTSTIEDSTSNSNDGTKSSANNPIQGDGQIGYAQDCTYDTINCGNDNSFDVTNLTVEVWFNIRSTGGSGYPRIVGVEALNNARPWAIERGGSGVSMNLEDNFGVEKEAGHIPFDWAGGSEFNTWIHGVWTFTSGTQKAFKNGIAGTFDNMVITLNNQDYDCRIANSPNANRAWDGLLDEIRVSDIVRSNNWVKTSFNAQDHPNTFMSFDNEEKQVPIGSHKSSQENIYKSKSSQESVYQHKSSQENIYEFKTVT